MKRGIMLLGARRESRPSLLLRHACSFITGNSMLYAKAVSPRRTDRLRRSIAAWKADLVVIGDTWLADLRPRLAGVAPAIAVDTHNVESRLYRRIVAEQTLRKRLKFELFRLNVQRLEEQLRHADMVFAVSEADAAVYRNEHGLERVEVLPNAIDVDHYAPRDDIADPAKLVFTGSYGYWPNEAAALHLIELSRQLRSLGVEHNVELVGRDPTPAMRAAAAGLTHVVIAGAVEDIRSHIARAGLVVAPLTSGSGTKYKILEALSLGRPVVTTPVGAEGLGLVDGVHASIASGLADLPQRVAALLRQPEATARMGEAGRAWVVDTHSLAALEGRLRTALSRMGLTAASSVRSDSDDAQDRLSHP